MLTLAGDDTEVTEEASECSEAEEELRIGGDSDGVRDGARDL